MVTGVNGFIASHVVKGLLDSGIRVKGTLRKLEPKLVEEIRGLSKNSDLLELHEVTLENDEGWEKTAFGCTALIHMASPLPANITTADIKDEELVTPAKDGTSRALEAAVNANIKKVIITSAASSFHGINRQKKDVYTEEDWGNEKDPGMDAYYKSKIAAEKLAWDFYKIHSVSDKEKFDLTVINPGTAVGPLLLKNQVESCSVRIITDILKGNTPNVPNINFILCDVRDIAKAHIKALNCPEAVGHRVPVTGGSLWFWDIVKILKKQFEGEGYSINSKQASNWTVRLFANMVRAYKKTIIPKIDMFYQVDSKIMKEHMKIDPIPLEDSIKATITSAIKFGDLKKP